MNGSIVTLNWLQDRLGQRELLIVDCRFQLDAPEEGRLAYESGHIPGAFYLDLKNDLSGKPGKHGGRHPLPDLGAFAIRLGAIGMHSASKVIAYDDQGGAMAARLWWMLRMMGHKEVYVLDRGYTAWKESGYPVTTEIPEPNPRIFLPRIQENWTVSMEEIRAKIGKPGVTLIDSRTRQRFLGEKEQLDPVAGHIPGAINRFWKENVNKDNSWKTPEELRERFFDISLEDEVIVYCGSGVTACPNVLALMEAGYSKVRLYAGSWSDWISYPDNPVAKGEE